METGQEKHTLMQALDNLQCELYWLINNNAHCTIALCHCTHDLAPLHIIINYLITVRMNVHVTQWVHWGVVEAPMGHYETWV